MNEVAEVRMADWAALIRQCTESGLTIKQWCAENNFSESQYYYRLKRLRKASLEMLLARPPQNEIQFARLPAQDNGDVALRIRCSDMTIEVSNGASEGILTVLKDVMSHVV